MPSAATIFPSCRSDTIRPPNGKIDSTKRSIKRAYMDRSYETRCILDPSENLQHFQFLESCPMMMTKYKRRKCIIVQYIIEEFPFPLPRNLAEI